MGSDCQRLWGFLWDDKHILELVVVAIVQGYAKKSIELHILKL